MPSSSRPPIAHQAPRAVEQIADVEDEDCEDGKGGHDEHGTRVPAPAFWAHFSAKSRRE